MPTAAPACAQGAAGDPSQWNDTARVPWMERWLYTAEAPSVLLDNFNDVVSNASTSGSLAQAVANAKVKEVQHIICMGEGEGGGLAVLCGVWAGLQVPTAQVDVVSFGVPWAGFNAQVRARWAPPGCVGTWLWEGQEQEGSCRPERPPSPELLPLARTPTSLHGLSSSWSTSTTSGPSSERAPPMLSSTGTCARARRRHSRLPACLPIPPLPSLRSATGLTPDKAYGHPPSSPIYWAFAVRPNITEDSLGTANHIPNVPVAIPAGYESLDAKDGNITSSLGTLLPPSNESLWPVPSAVPPVSWACKPTAQRACSQGFRATARTHAMRPRFLPTAPTL